MIIGFRMVLVTYKGVTYLVHRLQVRINLWFRRPWELQWNLMITRARICVSRPMIRAKHQF